LPVLTSTAVVKEHLGNQRTITYRFTAYSLSGIFKHNQGDEARLGIIPEKPLSGTIASTGIAGRGFLFYGCKIASETFTGGIKIVL
jgi:hypothetical protein